MDTSCFICTTPYQIIAATTIAINNADKSELYIVPQFAQAKEYADRIRESGIYRKVLFVDLSKIEAYKKRKNRFFYRFGIVKNYLKLNKIVQDIIGDVDYKTIYISSQANFGRLISIYYLKKGSKIVYFDDGEGSYSDYKIYEAQGIDRQIRKILFGSQSIRLSNNRQLYRPELYEMTFGKWDNLSVIPNWSKTPQLLEKINVICEYSKDANISQKYVLLDTIPCESFNKEGEKKYDKLVNICMDLLGEELLIKKHPRDNRKYKRACAVYPHTSIPFEVICANSDIENKVLIGAISSALLMPKLLLDAEPVVILLHHITGARLGEEEKREMMISYIKGLYRNKSKFIVPETLEEFIGIIKILKNKGGV